MYSKVQPKTTRRKKAESNNGSELPKLNTQARKDAHISQSKLAEMLGINTTTLVSYEKGRTPIKTDMLVKYAQICNVSTDFLLGLTESKTVENGLIHRKTGLSEDSIEMLYSHVICGDTAKIKILDFLLKQNHTKAIMQGFSGRGIKGANDLGLLNLITHYLIDDKDNGIEGIPCITSIVDRGSSLEIDSKYVTKGVLLNLIIEKLVEYKSEIKKMKKR